MASCYRILDWMDVEMRDRLLRDHRQLAIPANHQLMFESDWGDDVYLISAGIAKTRNLNRQGDETVISLMGPGALIGDLVVFSPKSIRTVDVVSLTPTTLFKLRHRALQEEIERSSAFLQTLACLQAQRLCSLGERLMLMNEDAKTRLLATLSLLARFNGPADDPSQPIPSISQQEIAAIAGLSRGTASTLINKLRSNGTLEETESGLRFSNLTALERRGLLPDPIPKPATG